MGKEIIQIQIKSIAVLIEKIRDEILKGKRTIEATIDTEKTKTYWNIGRHIYEHQLKNSEGREPGDYLFNILENALNIHKRTLYRAVQFYERYPGIMGQPLQLTWSHYTILLTVKDITKRKEYEQKVINENLSKRELLQLIKKDKEQDNGNKIPQILETRGHLNTYKLKLREEQQILFIDLGFRFYIDRLDNQQDYTEDSIIKITMKKSAYIIQITNDSTPGELFTYKGEVQEIIDGDTLWVNLDLGFDTWTRQKVRLRNINSARLGTEAGIKAKKFMEKRLNACEFIIVKTYYRDKYNRYLADIFYDRNEKAAFKVALNGIFLNQQLLDEGLAEKV